MKRKSKPYPVKQGDDYLLKEPDALLVYERYGTAFGRPVSGRAFRPAK